MATRAEHARTIAAACGNILPGNTIVAALVGWSMSETGGTPRPLNNMLSCGQNEPGAITYPNNKIVKGYPTIGLEGTAVADNLSENFSGYADLKRAIAGGYWDASVAAGLSTWSGGAYGNNWSSFIGTGNQHLNDQYDNQDTGEGFNPTTTTGSNGSGSSDPISQLADVLVRLTAPLLNAGQVLTSLSNIAKDPIRLVKFLVGISAMGIGMLMVLVDVVEIVNNSQPVQAIKKTASGAAKVVKTAAAVAG
jgi:hypothetical protein